MHQAEVRLMQYMRKVGANITYAVETLTLPIVLQPFLKYSETPLTDTPL